MEKKFLLGIFDDEEVLVLGATNLVRKGYSIYDIYTPFPVHGLDDLLAIKRTRLPYITFVAGALGLVVAMLAQSWISAVDWPLNVGGKPFLSIPAFIPIAFEITILFGALITVGSFFAISQLFPGQDPGLLHAAQTDDKFVLALDNSFDSLDVQALEKELKNLGASEVLMKSVN